MPTTPASAAPVRRIFPLDGGGAPENLTVDQLAALYAYPDGGHDHDHRVGRPDRTWLRANMVASVDGASTVQGRTRALSGAADRTLFGVLRSLADVILVGAQTARAERYRPVRTSEIRAELRTGRTSTPPIAVVSRRLDLDVDGALLTAAPPDARTIVITTELAQRERRAAAARHAEVVVAGEDTVDLSAAVAALADRGHRRLLTEGGPHLLGQLADAGLVGELCLTVSPLLAGSGPGRIVASLGPGHAPATLPGPAGADRTAGRPLRLAHVLESDGFLLCRYISEPEGVEQKVPN